MEERIKKFVKMPTKQKAVVIKKHLFRKMELMNRNNKFLPTGYCRQKGKNNIVSGPKVSILMPIYNHADVALFAIESIIKQTYKNIEIIILDDGSKDDLLKKLQPYYSLPNIKIYTQNNQKLPRALTHLHQLASGEFITWTSADNIMHPKMIETLVKKLMQEPDAALVYGDVYLIGANNKAYYGPCRDLDRDFTKPKIVRLLRNEKPLSLGTDNYINASFLYRADNSKALGGIYADDIIGAEDYDYWLRLQKSGHLVHIKEQKPFYYYRVHDNSMSHEIETKKAEEHRSRLEALKNYEQERIKWCEERPSIQIHSSISLSEKKEILSIAAKLPIDLELTSNKAIIFTKKVLNKKAYYLYNNNHYILHDNENLIVKVFEGVDIPREAYKARNFLSHPYYDDNLVRVKSPIFGCHIESKKYNIDSIEKVISNNSKIHFVIIDEHENNELKELAAKFNNFSYFANREYGTEYRLYSNFARTIAFDCYDDLSKYKNIILSYAIGRRINYISGDELMQSMPYTLPIKNGIIDFTKPDGITDEDYLVMDKYIRSYSRVGRLDKAIKLYNAHTQELYVERPKYKVAAPALEDLPKRVN